MTPFNGHLQAAVGYLELGLPLEANEEIEAIEPEMKTLSEVLAVRVEIFRALGKWELMRIVCRQLCHQAARRTAMVRLAWPRHPAGHRLAGGLGCAGHGRQPVSDVRDDLLQPGLLRGATRAPRLSTGATDRKRSNWIPRAGNSRWLILTPWNYALN